MYTEAMRFLVLLLCYLSVNKSLISFIIQVNPAHTSKVDENPGCLESDKGKRNKPPVFNIIYWEAREQSGC